MSDIVILGIFVADTAYRADRQPKMGETILGTSFVLGPGGKGSNQSVAAAMAGGKTSPSSAVWARTPSPISRGPHGPRPG
jgi:ribokinase